MTWLTNLSTRLLLTGVLLGSSIQLAPVNCTGQTQPPTSPPQTHTHIENVPNLYRVKQILISYHDCTCKCGCYANELEQVAGEAQSYLAARLVQDPQQSDKLAIVLDI